MVRYAWKCVTQQTVQNCWRHTKILPSDSAESTDDPAEDEDDPADDDILLADLQLMMRDLLQDPAVDAGEYIDIDSHEETAPSLDDETIISLVNPNQDDTSDNEQNDENDQHDDSAKDVPSPPTAKKARSALREAIAFFEMIGDTDTLDKLTSICNKVKPANLRQSTMNDYFQNA